MCLVIELLDPCSTESPMNLNVLFRLSFRLLIRLPVRLSVFPSVSLEFSPRTALNCFIYFEVYANKFLSLQVFL